jgi:hypothetical protein
MTRLGLAKPRSDLEVRAREFERDKFNICAIWTAADAEPVKATDGYTACER